MSFFNRYSHPLKRWIPWFLLVGAAASLGSCGPAKDSPTESPDVSGGNPEPNNNHGPNTNFRSNNDVRGEKNFAILINQYSQSKAEPTPWAGFWWPYTGNGIAAGGFFNNASPAGRYDAARGNKTHAQLWEVTKHGSRVPNLQGWWGHCNGWCAAAALTPEPHENIKINGIDFGIGDQKALLSEAGMSVNADFFGERIDVDDPNSPKYWDTVPDQYFLVLTNYMGKQKKTVLIDRYTGSQVWNQPVAAYRFEYPKREDYLGNSPEAPHVYRILLRSKIWWMDDGVAPDCQTHAFNFEEDDPTGMIQSRELAMEVWMDAPAEFDSSGKIVKSGNVIVAREGDYLAGGAWRMGEGYMVDAWPDYMWIPYSMIKPTDPEEDYANPEVDVDWLRAHLLVPGGADDTTVEPGHIEPAPVPHPQASGWPTLPRPGSTPNPNDPFSNFPPTNPGTSGWDPIPNTRSPSFPF